MDVYTNLDGSYVVNSNNMSNKVIVWCLRMSIFTRSNLRQSGGRVVWTRLVLRLSRPRSRVRFPYLFHFPS